MLPTKFEQIYLRLIWKVDTSAEVYREMLMEFSKIKGKGICVYLYEKNIYIRRIYKCASRSLYNRNVCYSKTKINHTRENLKHCIDSSFVSYKIGNGNLFSSITGKRLSLTFAICGILFIMHSIMLQTINVAD